jgi:hypothetical protein
MTSTATTHKRGYVARSEATATSRTLKCTLIYAVKVRRFPVTIKGNITKALCHRVFVMILWITPKNLRTFFP